MINSNFVLLAALINFFGCTGYLIGTIKGTIKPNRVTWLLWAIAPLIAFAAQIKQGVGIESALTFIVGFSPLIIFLASFINKKSYWKLTTFDFICGFLSVCGLILWAITKEGIIAIACSILADTFAAIPTIVKSYQEPETENAWAYITGVIAGFITLLTLRTWTFVYSGYPIYVFSMNLILAILVQLKIGKRLK
jgi:hypothetical protein